MNCQEGVLPRAAYLPSRPPPNQKCVLHDTKALSRSIGSDFLDSKGWSKDRRPGRGDNWERMKVEELE